MAFQYKLFASHLRQSESKNSAYERFDALWIAFNVYYESCFIKGENIKERPLIHRALQVIPPSEYGDFINMKSVEPLLRIEPIFNEKIWQRKGCKDQDEHTRAQNLLKEALAGPCIQARHVEALADVLYIIRCNMVHGFKTIDGPRDQEVLDAAVNIMTPFMYVLARNMTSRRNSAGVFPSATLSRCASSIPCGRFRRHCLRNSTSLILPDNFRCRGLTTCGSCRCARPRRERSTRPKRCAAAGVSANSTGRSAACFMSALCSRGTKPPC